MKYLLVFLVSLLLPVSVLSGQSGFLAEQTRYERVRRAVAEKGELIEQVLYRNGLSKDNVHILIAAFKAESILEIHARDKTGEQYRKIAEYRICARSGQLGPKRRQGDRQVPEGFYHVDRFNPSSSYVFSLGVSYPNRSDRLKSDASNLGGDIFIHGSCVTIGCIPVTDDEIREIYLYAIHARNNGQVQIPVYIFPFRMEPEKMKAYGERYNQDTALPDFWQNLGRGYALWKETGRELSVAVDRDGNYTYGDE